MAEVSEWCTDTQQQQKLSLHSRKRRRSLEETHSRKSPAVSLTWSTPQVLEGERSSSSGGSGSAANATQALMQMWTNPMQPPIQGCLPSLEDLACGNTTGLRPQAITKAQLDTARPLHQVSKQFVPLVCGRIVAIMDQHAAAERVRLEQLQQEVIAEDGYPKQGDSVRLRPAQLLQLSPAELQMLQHHRAHLEAWGWQFAHPDLCCATGALITHAAAVLGTPLNFTELQSFLQQLRQTDGVARVPQAVHRLLVSRACHSAIRFGDVLSADQCEQLVQALRKTVSWHCCAHGRPTIMPLVDMAHLQSLLQMRP
ncbi:g485 [Coccomyxa viridis]|uniref:G485 protein n=1 Tax=Coccomyxa viridis TaxID=1274662 RepID=A0ABP1FIR6_9CHLO